MNDYISFITRVLILIKAILGVLFNFRPPMTVYRLVLLIRKLNPLSGDGIEVVGRSRSALYRRRDNFHALMPKTEVYLHNNAVSNLKKAVSNCSTRPMPRIPQSSAHANFGARIRFLNPYSSSVWTSCHINISIVASVFSISPWPRTSLYVFSWAPFPLHFPHLQEPLS